jgi:hypothetical protein
MCNRHVSKLTKINILLSITKLLKLCVNYVLSFNKGPRCIVFMDISVAHLNIHGWKKRLQFL